LFVQKKVIKENHTPLPLVSFGLSAASGAAAELALSALKQSSPLPICWLKPKARQGDDNPLSTTELGRVGKKGLFAHRINGYN
jgi:hypothetical protein